MLNKGISGVQWAGVVFFILSQSWSAAMFKAWASELKSKTSEEVVYFCPPCGCKSDGKTFSQPGICPSCPMALEKLEAHYRNLVTIADSGPRKRHKVAILIFDQVQIIDYTGPFEVFGAAGYDVLLVSKEQKTIHTNMGMKVIPDHTLANCPDVDILLVPGGGVSATENDPQVIKWLTTKAAETPHVMTVCNGTFILAKTGLLDGKTATTTYGLIGALKNLAPKVTVVRDQRFVDLGKIVTTAGLTSGMDGALHLVSKINGTAFAQRVALGLEYDWQQTNPFVRGRLADSKLVGRILGPNYYPMLDAPGTRWRLANVNGDSSQWRVSWEITGGGTPAQVHQFFETKLKADGPWNLANKAINQESITSYWRFKDSDDQSWQGMVHVKPDSAQNANLIVSLEIKQTP